MTAAATYRVELDTGVVCHDGAGLETVLSLAAGYRRLQAAIRALEPGGRVDTLELELPNLTVAFLFSRLT